MSCFRDQICPYQCDLQAQGSLEDHQYFPYWLVDWPPRHPLQETLNVPGQSKKRSHSSLLENTSIIKNYF